MTEETVTIPLAKYASLQAKVHASEGQISFMSWDSNYYYFLSKDELLSKMMDQIKKLEDYNRLLAEQLRETEKGKR